MPPPDLPPFDNAGNLPVGVHRVSIDSALAQLGSGTLRRSLVARRLLRIYELAQSTRHLARFIVFGSFVTAKSEPNDVDIFLIMDDDFEVSDVHGETALVFDHLVADSHFGASVFWARRVGCMGGEESAILDWQTRRDGGKRGIIEIISEST